MNTLQFYGKISSDGMTIRRDPVKATEYVDFKLLLGKDSAPVPFRAFGDMARTIYLHAAPGDRLIGEAKFFTVDKYFRFDVLSVEFVDRVVEQPKKPDEKIIALFRQRINAEKVINRIECLMSRSVATSEIRECADTVIALIATSSATPGNLSNITTESVTALIAQMFDGNQKTGYQKRYIRDLAAYVGKWCKEVRV